MTFHGIAIALLTRQFMLADEWRVILRNSANDNRGQG